MCYWSSLLEEGLKSVLACLDHLVKYDFEALVFGELHALPGLVVTCVVSIHLEEYLAWSGLFKFWNSNLIKYRTFKTFSWGASEEWVELNDLCQELCVLRVILLQLLLKLFLHLRVSFKHGNVLLRIFRRDEGLIFITKRTQLVNYSFHLVNGILFC